MSASVSWLDLAADDRDNIRRILDLFNEPGPVDVLGVKRSVIERGLEKVECWSDRLPALRCCTLTNYAIE